MDDSTLQQWPKLRYSIGKQKFCFFFYSITSRPLASVFMCKIEKDSEKEKKRGGRGLKSTLLVNRNVTTQALSSNTKSNTSNNLRSFQQQQHQQQQHH